MKWVDIAMSAPTEAIYNEPYEARGIIHSEVALIIGMVKHLDIRYIVESGMARAQSTYMLARYLPQVKVLSIEPNDNVDTSFGYNRIKDFSNVVCFKGYSQDVIPHLVKGQKHKGALLIDGPKDIEALNIVKHFDFEVSFVHDLKKLKRGKPSEARKEAERMGGFFTDDQDYVEKTSWMDRNVWEKGILKNFAPYYLNDYPTGSYGPTLGVFYEMG